MMPKKNEVTIAGNPPEHHFAGAGKVIEIGKGGQRGVDDYQLSRFHFPRIRGN